MLELLLLGMAGIVGGLITAGVNNNMAQQREEMARAENYRYNEMAAQAQDERTRALYTDLQSPQAQIGNTMQALKQNGLSPALFYSGGASVGGGVSQSPIGNGSNGISPNIFGAPAMSATDIANTKLINAQAEKAEAEAENIKKRNVTEEERGNAELMKLLSEAGLNNATKAYTESQTTYTNIQNNIAKATTENQIKAAMHEANKLQYEEMQAIWDAENSKIDAETKQKIQESLVQESINRAANVLVDTQLKQSQITLNEEQKKNLIAETQAVLTNAAANQKNAETAARQANNAAEANKIRRQELNKNIEMFNKELNLKWKQYNLEQTDISYKYGEKTIIHLGNMYSPMTSEQVKINPANMDK